MVIASRNTEQALCLTSRGVAHEVGF